MSEIINPPPGETAAEQEAASRHNSTANPPLDGSGEGVALDDHLNPNPNAFPGSAGPRAGPGAGPPIENPPPWYAAEPAEPEHEAPPLGPLNPPTTGSSEAVATAAKPKTAKRRTSARKTSK